MEHDSDDEVLSKLEVAIDSVRCDCYQLCLLMF